MFPLLLKQAVCFVCLLLHSREFLVQFLTSFVRVASLLFRFLSDNPEPGFLAICLYITHCRLTSALLTVQSLNR
jgi:hypothetical protein